MIELRKLNNYFFETLVTLTLKFTKKQNKIYEPLSSSPGSLQEKGCAGILANS